MKNERDQYFKDLQDRLSQSLEDTPSTDVKEESLDPQSEYAKLIKEEEKAKTKAKTKAKKTIVKKKPEKKEKKTETKRLLEKDAGKKVTKTKKTEAKK